MKKVLTIIFIQIFYVFVFLAFSTPVRAACSFVINTPAPIAAGGSITLTVTGQNGEYFTALIIKEDGSITPSVAGTLIETNSTGVVSLNTPIEAGNYSVGVWRGSQNNVIENCGQKPFTLHTDLASCQGFLGCLGGISTPNLRFNNPATFIGDLITGILPIILALGGFLTVILIVISGIQFIVSSGNPEAAGAARSRLVFAIIGLVLIILAFSITKIVDTIFLGGSGVL